MWRIQGRRVNADLPIRDKDVVRPPTTYVSRTIYKGLSVPLATHEHPDPFAQLKGRRRSRPKAKPEPRKEPRPGFDRETEVLLEVFGKKKKGGSKTPITPGANYPIGICICCGGPLKKALGGYVCKDCGERFSLEECGLQSVEITSIEDEEKAGRG